MEILPNLTKNDKDYVPTYEELGLTEYDFNFHMASEIGQRLYDEKIIKWMKENSERIDKEKARKSKREKEKIESIGLHWYNLTDKQVLIESIEKSRSKVDSAIDNILKSQTKQSLIIYYNRLRDNVKVAEVNIKDADFNKLKRFPKYNRATNELFGGDARFIALWSHVFSLRK